jgi:hypothetical protein
MNVPSAPLSSDIIDRRDGQTPTLAEKVRDLMIKVHTDYQQSFGSDSSPIGPDPNDADALRAQVHSVLGSGDDKSLSSNAAARIRSKVNSGK